MGNLCHVLIVEFHHRLARKKQMNQIVSRFSESGYKVQHQSVGSLDVFSFAIPE